MLSFVLCRFANRICNRSFISSSGIPHGEVVGIWGRELEAQRVHDSDCHRNNVVVTDASTSHRDLGDSQTVRLIARRDQHKIKELGQGLCSVYVSKLLSQRSLMLFFRVAGFERARVRGGRDGGRGPLDSAENATKDSRESISEKNSTIEPCCLHPPCGQVGFIPRVLRIPEIL